jgi:CYTH domain-containing protein
VASLVRDGKYARVERERRFLLVARPAGPWPVLPPGEAARRITDRYWAGTRMRLRRVDYQDGRVSEFKLTQKVPAQQSGHVRGLITNTYLSEAEYQFFAGLPADVIVKTRLSGAEMLAVDVFEGELTGLLIAEAEFSSDAEASAFVVPAGVPVAAEITDDNRFTGGRLARTRRRELAGWLAGFGLELAAG